MACPTPTTLLPRTDNKANCTPPLPENNSPSYTHPLPAPVPGGEWVWRETVGTMRPTVSPVVAGLRSSYRASVEHLGDVIGCDTALQRDIEQTGQAVLG